MLGTKIKVTQELIQLVFHSILAAVHQECQYDLKNNILF